jgi:hypothetical protein
LLTGNLAKTSTQAHSGNWAKRLERLWAASMASALS